MSCDVFGQLEKSLPERSQDVIGCPTLACFSLERLELIEMFQWDLEVFLVGLTVQHKCMSVRARVWVFVCGCACVWVWGSLCVGVPVCARELVCCKTCLY